MPIAGKFLIIFSYFLLNIDMGSGQGEGDILKLWAESTLMRCQRPGGNINVLLFSYILIDTNAMLHLFHWHFIQQLHIFWNIGNFSWLLTKTKSWDGRWGGAKVNIFGSVQYLGAEELGFDEWSDAKVSIQNVPEHFFTHNWCKYIVNAHANTERC